MSTPRRGRVPVPAAVALLLLVCGIFNPAWATTSLYGNTAQDTTRGASADTSAAAGTKSVWTMDELKTVLGNETAGLTGGEYRERKSGRVAMACALLFPGLGQMYNEKPLKAAIASAFEWYYLTQILLNRRYCAREREIRDTYPTEPNPSSDWLYHDRWATEYWERSVDWTWWWGAAVVVITIDAYVDAHLDDMHFSVEVRGDERGVELGLVFPH